MDVLRRLLTLALVLGAQGYTAPGSRVRDRRTIKLRSPRPPQKSAMVPYAGRRPQPLEIEKADLPFAHKYWYDPRIHTLGNIGLGGFLHAAFAPLATWAIDMLSYGGVDVRRSVLKTLPQDATVLDLCCGTGFSTAPGATGVDTSPEMLWMARLRRPDATFVQGNAETYGETNSYDIVTCMFATHEMPAAGRRRVLRNAARVARKGVVVLDIDPNFEATLKKKPQEGAAFLAGEPYVLEYLKKVDADMASVVKQRGWRVSRNELLPGHCVMWHLHGFGAGGQASLSNYVPPAGLPEGDYGL